VLNQLDNCNDTNNSMMPTIKRLVRSGGFETEEGQEIIRDLFLENAEKIKQMFNILVFLKSEKRMNRQVMHDLNNVAVSAEAMMELSLDSALSNKKIKLEFLNILVSAWDRYLVGLEDILLRVVSKNSISSENNNGLNAEVIGGAINYFAKKEIPYIKSFSKNESSNYKEIDNKQINILSPEDWDKLMLELGDKQITGNTGLIGNFLLNAMRNSLNDRVQAKNVRLLAQIKDNMFIFRVEDDGKGMATKFLQKDNKEKDEVTDEEKDTFIFYEGVSDNLSTGTGLADFDTRLASVGGELYVVTKSVSDGLVRF